MIMKKDEKIDQKDQKVQEGYDEALDENFDGREEID